MSYEMPSFDINVGIKAYQVGKGKPPQTKERVEQRIYDSSEPQDSLYRRYLRRSDIGRYKVIPLKQRYLKFGPWLAVGTILIAIAIWQSGTLSRWSGIPFALGFVLYLPQFLGSQPIRVAHGLLVALGCIWIAFGMGTSTVTRK